jgi:hypothetical protein
MRAAAMAAFVVFACERLLFSKQLLVILQLVVVFLIAQITAIVLSAVADPAIVVVPCAFKVMGKKQAFEIGASLEDKILFAADAAVGKLLVAFRACSTSNRRIGAAEGTAHDKLQVAVAYLCHGGVLLFLVYLVSIVGLGMAGR